MSEIVICNRFLCPVRVHRSPSPKIKIKIKTVPYAILGLVCYTYIQYTVIFLSPFFSLRVLHHNHIIHPNVSRNSVQLNPFFKVRVVQQIVRTVSSKKHKTAETNPGPTIFCVNCFYRQTFYCKLHWSEIKIIIIISIIIVCYGPDIY